MIFVSEFRHTWMIMTWQTWGRQACDLRPAQCWDLMGWITLGLWLYYRYHLYVYIYIYRNISIYIYIICIYHWSSSMIGVMDHWDKKLIRVSTYSFGWSSITQSPKYWSLQWVYDYGDYGQYGVFTYVYTYIYIHTQWIYIIYPLYIHCILHSYCSDPIIHWD